MKITNEIVSKLNPCKDRFDNFTKYYPDFDGDLKSFIELENIDYSDKVWVVTRLFSKEKNVMWAVMCAESVLHLFEEKYPDDKRPRLAIEAAKNSNSSAARAARAARAASGAAWAARAERAARAASDAAWAARAARAARAAWAAWAASDAAWAVRAARAARAASDAASAASSAASAVSAEKEQETKNLSFMLMCEEKGE